MRRFPFYLVSTPIGNLDDLSPRAVEVLAEVDLILAEDTRRTRKLLAARGIETPLRSFHDHNKERVAPEVVRLIEGGGSIALVSDAGTPSINDPGYYMVRTLVERGIEFTAVPGPSAILTALVLSGLPTDRFAFYGYMPRKKGEREKAILEAGDERGTAIFFESPHRLLKTLQVLHELLPGREIVVARELTKMHEELRRGIASELLEYFGSKGVKGEIVILLRGLGRKGVRS
jgi:16S rRNA (cytidine1402-2'-O)-methyltransferase